MTVFVLVCSIFIVILALAFAFSTGFNEPNVAAVVISTKAIPLRTALLVVGLLEFIGACLGAGIAAAGFGVIQWLNIFLIFGILATSPILGLIVSFLVTKFVYLV